MRMVRGSNPRTTCCRVLWLATKTITTLATIQKTSYARFQSDSNRRYTTVLQAAPFVRSGMEPLWAGRDSNPRNLWCLIYSQIALTACIGLNGVLKCCKNIQLLRLIHNGFTRYRHPTIPLPPHWTFGVTCIIELG